MKDMVKKIIAAVEFLHEIYGDYPILGKHLPSTHTAGNSWFDNEVTLEDFKGNLDLGASRWVSHDPADGGGYSETFEDLAGELEGTWVQTRPISDAVVQRDAHGFFLEGEIEEFETHTKYWTLGFSKEPHPVLGWVYVLATIFPGRPDKQSLDLLKKKMAERGLEWAVGTVVPLDLLLETGVRVKGRKA